ncbi:PhzF family phenazine biosynthesis protein [Hoyosella rhizosphaerae]|uniref:Isomerase n=1 Tax=Hoyosella rhizosphaerae TaxID=1755582 RepID=A0A916UGC2_9ACTN|nr:PhzF family phenazine biosynthesis protein [Hoyosella rhizosphaerae]MBN4928060.1 PhzF family phenazine biosynthesis protein [Hoyosella rhizosphaerae]GGC72089.1 isomerase [Hoyosella rhizosphaerae]
MYHYQVIDAFTDVPFRGNPAAVFILERPYDSAWAQNVAAEFNLAETAFALPIADDTWDLRWFTPEVEVDLCGHATLATAHVLAAQGHSGPFRFATRSGILTVSETDNMLWMDFPSEPPERMEADTDIQAALGAPVLGAWKGATGDILVELPDEHTVRMLQPNLEKIASIPARGVIVTAPATDEHDFISRFFAPAVGVPEDPVTGSAHTVLAPFWAERLNRSHLRGFQSSRRGGTVHIRIEKPGRVLLGGNAVSVMAGTFNA